MSSHQLRMRVARCMAPSDLKKALSFDAVRLASLERVQQRPHPVRRFGEQREMFELTKISSKDRILLRTGTRHSRFGVGGEERTLVDSVDECIFTDYGGKFRGSLSGTCAKWGLRSNRDLKQRPESAAYSGADTNYGGEFRGRQTCPIPEESGVQSGAIEVTETSSQDRNLQRTVEQGSVEEDKTSLRSGFLKGRTLQAASIPLVQGTTRRCRSLVRQNQASQLPAAVRRNMRKIATTSSSTAGNVRLRSVKQTLGSAAMGTTSCGTRGKRNRQRRGARRRKPGQGAAAGMEAVHAASAGASSRLPRGTEENEHLGIVQRPSVYWTSRGPAAEQRRATRTKLNSPRSTADIQQRAVHPRGAASIRRTHLSLHVLVSLVQHGKGRVLRALRRARVAQTDKQS